MESNKREVIYDEAKVPSYSLPDPLVSADGKPVTSSEMWFNQQRPAILEQFEHYVYGKTPQYTLEISYKTTSKDTGIFSGLATRKQITIQLGKSATAPEIHVLMYLPADKANSKIPVFLGLNFRGNHTIHPDPGIHITPQWIQDIATGEQNLDQPGNDTRGSSGRRWPIEYILSRGYGLVTAHYGDIDPDYFDNFQNGVHKLFPRDDTAGNAWGAICAWAWGLSRIMDYLETAPDIDSSRVALIGHSRLGKTSLWAGAQDTRFAVVISNDSGCGGAALSRRRYGETIAAINTQFPHWFCTNFKAYNNHEDALPVDQHELIALIAPRPAYVASAVEDRWADPLGEFLSCKMAHPVYKLLHTDGLPADVQPSLNDPVSGQIGYHIRAGGHDVTKYDWQQFMNFTDRHFR